MKMQQDFDRSAVYTERSPRNGMSNFLSGIAVVLSLLAFLLSGFTAFQVFGLRQAIEAVRSTDDQTNASTQAAPVVMGSNPPAPISSPASSPASASSSSAAIQPGQFVQPAFSNKAQVELLKVNRIPGQRDLINVQVRVRVLRPEKAVGTDVIALASTTARNPQTSETYRAVSNESTGAVSLFMMGQVDKQTSADAYVWLRVPAGVNAIDIYLPNTEAFENVPIS